MRRAYKFRVYPTTGQTSRAGQCLRDHQRLYNAALEERREAWRMRKTSIRYGQQSAQLKDIRAFDPDQGRWSFSSQSRVRVTSLEISSSAGRAWLMNTISAARNSSIASTDVSWAWPAISKAVEC